MSYSVMNLQENIRKKYNVTFTLLGCNNFTLPISEIWVNKFLAQ